MGTSVGVAVRAFVEVGVNSTEGLTVGLTVTFGVGVFVLTGCVLFGVGVYVASVCI